MGDRVLMQCHSAKSGRFGPVVYCHWLGDKAPQIVNQLINRMRGRSGDVDCTSARLVQECTLAQADPATCMGIGVWNSDHLLTAKDSHGDAGCVLIDVDNWAITYVGGYLEHDGLLKSTEQQAQDALYAHMATTPLVGAN
jgi:hypothetical protein